MNTGAFRRRAGGTGLCGGSAPVYRGRPRPSNPGCMGEQRSAAASPLRPAGFPKKKLKKTENLLDRLFIFV
jgi:hypothetical protein